MGAVAICSCCNHCLHSLTAHMPIHTCQIGTSVSVRTAAAYMLRYMGCLLIVTWAPAT